MKKIHLSFDDGPHSSNTPLVLDILKAHQIKSTFFVLGERVKAHGKIISRIVTEGHRVGNHTYSHKQLTTLSDREIKDEIISTEKLISQYAPTDYIIRPPYGARNTRVNNLIASLNYHSVLWSVDTEDWKRKPDTWINYGIEQIKKRELSLVLMHDIHATTAAGLQRFIEQVKMTGAEFADLEYITGFPPPDTTINPLPSAEPPAPTLRYHVVKTGETLSSIAKKYYGTTHQWRKIYQANMATISNPNVITAGMRLLIL
ncbi:polysaccharide deacetylase family protein [Erwinia psidii]|uniref:LysM peptidoglycan-binding domain-containing protein n=1 Tax=Erwinia psidii TaxID=69224 RepID=A0A3N6SPR9_9GAMM|nr:polysaccharide deacetylase family protein [Erwinia psidii]MCX8956484.1 LysM peptidoglycan-binding domain-containing protein [Erwinia psidii]MCX8962330.1 LysM peptidoglycan-binding domain-containing protein [Erwinia psidii]MCX8965877.1 LysM peptidoglycan-binding domain-containing protein [Erwinia psidii]RQM39816.1 LysM peptidoglycan-binding domain-containing protein [Erwinia psidii]